MQFFPSYFQLASFLKYKQTLVNANLQKKSFFLVSYVLYHGSKLVGLTQKKIHKIGHFIDLIPAPDARKSYTSFL
jgi:hypothetical protein